MDWKEIIANQFVWGLALGLLIAGFILKNAIGSKMQLKREIRRIEGEMRDMQSHLNTQMKITATGNESLTKEVTTLKEQNENLRVNLSALQSKPEKNEQRQFRMQEMAISTMREQAPGFAGAWEKAMRQAESEMDAAESGFSKLVRKVVPGLSYSGTRPTATETQVIESKSEDS
ncbi:MAG: hypothetical protein NWT08_12075 [Akkermansiaceae bacterium]|jgi:predicted  nucleic acid-binding Zn-ribbon protein|nr:hypothetical protein [Akkermansiaceae bacterium]MDP4722076.1 hypothetical protein [Akkermansiaceae bacterium]MDP4781438.1 hypothetical protein [Akkermansiaceae bacterium]MDP4848071.1 hypothetical protein [Akkermansiaceae bacterium]MDP4899088.1 hypothetical protein [Akkermansiaceae bacterium]